MKKQLQRTWMLALLMIFGAASAWALTADLSMSYELVGYKAKAFYDLTANSDGVLPTSGDLRHRDGYGFYNFGSGGRSATATIPVSQGDVVVCQFADTQNRGITINSISGCEKSTTLSDGSHIFFEASSDLSELTFNVGRAGCVVSVLVMEVDASVATADYTLSYVCDGETVKTVAATGAVGGIVLTDASFFVDDMKYFRAEGEPESFTIAAEGNAFTVKVRKAATYSYTLTDNFGTTVVSGTGLEGEKAYAAYSRYQIKDGKFYEAAVTNKEYRKTIALDADNATATVTYEERKDTVAVFFTEGEDISGITVSTSGNIPVRASNAKAGISSEDIAITTLPAGKYKFHVGVFTSKSSKQDVNIMIGEQTFTASSSGNLAEVTSEEYELTAETTITFLGTTTSADAQLDYIWVEKTGDVEAPATAKTIGLVPNVWATDGAIFAAYAFNSDEDNAWFPFAEIGGAFGTQIPENYAKIIAVRLKPATDESFDATNNGLNWNNKWNQTDDIDFTALADNTVITITGWGEGEGANSTYTTSTAEVPVNLDELKAALTEGVALAEQLNAIANDETLAEAITAAKAALENEEATVEDLTVVATALAVASDAAAKTALQNAVAQLKPYGIDTTAAEAVLASADSDAEDYFNALKALSSIDKMKEVLQTAVTKAKELNTYLGDDALAFVILVAEAALETEGITAETLLTSIISIAEASKKAAKDALQTIVDMAESYGIDATAAKALLDDEEATVEQYTQGMLALAADTQTKAKAALDEAKKFFDEFASDALTALADDIKAVEDALNGTNVGAIKEAIKTLSTNAKPYLKEAMEKVAEYLAVINNDDLNADIAAMKAAAEEGNINALVTAVKKAKEDFLDAVPEWVDGIEYALAQYKDNGKTNFAENVEASINSVRIVMADESASFVMKGTVVYQLFRALKEYNEANSVYALTGNAEFLGKWDTKANVMTLDGDLYTITFDNVNLENGFELQYKVVKTDIDDNEIWYPEGDNLTYTIWQGTGEYDLTFTFDRKTEEITCSVVPDAIRALIAQAEELAATNGVAVGKLEQAIEKAKVGDYNAEQLQAAMVQYNKDNAPQETDLTNQFSALTDPANWTNAIGASTMAYAGWAAPKVHVDGKEVALVESYDQGQEFKQKTGDVMYQDITGLTPGTYAIELFGAACLTPGRAGMTTDFEEGDANSLVAAYLYAQSGDQTVKEYIPSLIEENMNNRGGEEAIPTAKLNGVVVGTDGTIRVGLAKELGLTNWHFVQLKGVIAQVPAKDLWTLVQKELKALVEEAKNQLADEYKTEGKDDFQTAVTAAEQAVDSRMHNIAEVETLIADLKTAMKTFEVANYSIALEPGEYYIQAVDKLEESKLMFMAAGHDYGTRGIISETGLDFTVTRYDEPRTYTFDSRVSNGDGNHFLGVNLYMDSSSWGWVLEKYGVTYGIKDPENGKYINFDENDNLVLSDTPAMFFFFPKDEYIAIRLSNLEGATESEPKDATFLLQNPNFNRNDQRVSAWEVTFTEGNNSNLNGGNQVNNCGESYHAAFTVKQTVEGAPKGVYALTAQGFYRQDEIAEGQDAPAAPVFFANGVNKDVPVMGVLADHDGNGTNSMGDASVEFTAGNYTIEPIMFEVTDEGEDSGKIYVGVTTAVTNQWVIFDNFRLLYYGKDCTTGISELTANGQNAAAAAEGIYNLQGQRVEKAKKGLYIINGKKVVRK